MNNDRNTSYKCVCTCYSYLLDPTPPGSIIFSQRTNSSISLKWATPALMENAPNISYSITYQSDGGNVQYISSLVNSTALNSLFSGTSYNITVQTVGAMNLSSTFVYNSTFTCKYNRKKQRK